MQPDKWWKKRKFCYISEYKKEEDGIEYLRSRTKTALGVDSTYLVIYYL